MADKARTAPQKDSSDSPPAHGHEATVRKGYQDAQGPEKQGDGDPGPDQISEQSSQQGQARRGGTGRG